MMTYFLSNEYFNIEADNQGVSIVQNPRDTKKTQFVSDNEHFFQPVLVYSQGGENHEVKVSELEAKAVFGRGGEVNELNFLPADSIGPIPPGLVKKITKGGDERTSFLNFKHTDPQRKLDIDTRYVLNGAAVLYNLTVKNISSDPMEIVDLSMHMPTNTHFKWGVPGGDKVISHMFFGGHGGYVYMKRTDGQGPYLVMLPQGGLAFEYAEYLENKTEGRHRYTNLFMLSKNSCQKAALNGSRTRGMSSSVKLVPGEERTFTIRLSWAETEEEIRDTLAENGGLDIRSMPGYTITNQTEALLTIRSKYGDITVNPEFPETTEIKLIRKDGDRIFYKIKFSKLGENRVNIAYVGKWACVYYFITEPIETILDKRTGFLKKTQCVDDNKWYKGLFQEWNNKTNIPVNPDNYDDIKGWRIYAPASDDPSYGKPAFFASKLAVRPEQSEVDALDDYIEFFVWGGMQMTEEEEYPYAVFGTPDWHANRTSDNPGLGRTSRPGRLHFWRIYDYPHIFLMYYNMYLTAKDYPDIKTRLTAGEYLKRAYKTAWAMYIYPHEVDSWSPYFTGLMNEMIVPDIIKSLRREGLEDWAKRLEFHWMRKVRNFAIPDADIFGSEYPFDTTGFETIHSLAKTALETAAIYAAPDYSRKKTLTRATALAYMEKAINANMSCRGTMEPSYFQYGSDYRGLSQTTLSYMSQMGGWAILDYGLYYAGDPFEFIRVGYGSVLSSWAIINTGTEESKYGYWFPGKDMDGTACGVFEIMPSGTTWLGQEHKGGVWYYSGEADCGFCAGVRGMATVLAEDPVFGICAFGGALTEEKGGYKISVQDGIGRRFHAVTGDRRLHLVLEQGKLKNPISVSKDFKTVSADINVSMHIGRDIIFQASSQFETGVRVFIDDKEQEWNQGGEYKFKAEKDSYKIRLEA